MTVIYPILESLSTVLQGMLFPSVSPECHAVKSIAITCFQRFYPLKSTDENSHFFRRKPEETLHQ